MSYSRRLGNRSTAWLLLTSLAVGLFVLAWIGLMVVVATYEGRFSRAEARMPVEAVSADETSFEYSLVATTADLTQAWVVYIRPVRPDAPPPPGLSRWPNPGESVISPAAQAALNSPGSWSAWSPGSIVGFIAPEGLTTATESFAYVNPPAGAQIAANEWLQGKSFGGTGLAGLGDTMSFFELPLFVLLYVPTVVVPATLLLAAVWLEGSKRRRRAEQVLALLGSTPLQRLALRIGGVAPAWAVGSGLAAAVLGLAITTDLIIPFVDYHLLSVDLRRWAAALLLVWFATVAASLLLLQAQAPARSLVKKRRRDRPGILQWIAAAVGLFSVVGAIPLVNASPLGGEAEGAYLTVLALVLAVFTMPVLCAVTVWLLTVVLRRTGSVGRVVGVGLLRQGRGPVAALAGTIGSSLCMLTAVNAFVGVPAPFEEAKPVYAASVGHVVTISSARLDLSLLTPQRLEGLTRQADRFVLAVADEVEGLQTWRLYADASSLRGEMQGGECRFSGDTPISMSYALRFMDLSSCPQTMVGRVPPGAAWRLILYRENRGLSATTFASTVAGWVAPPPVIDVPASEFIQGGPTSTAVQIQWIPWCATVGLLLMLAALLLFAIGDLRQAQSRIAGYLILGAPDSTAVKAMAIRLGIPVSVALGYGLIFSLQRPLVDPNRVADYSVGLFVGYATVIVVGVVTAVAANSIAARRHLPSWRPGRGRE